MIAYRDAAAADLPAVDALFRDSFVATFGHLYVADDLAAFLGGFMPQRWAEELAQPATVIRLAERDGALVGYAKVGAPTLPIALDGPAVELRQLYLAEAAQGTGVGVALMDWIIAHARGVDAAEVVLSVYVDNHRARRFYERYGFVDAGPYHFMVGAHADEDRLMRLAL